MRGANAFLRTLLWSPGRAAEAAWWFLRGKRVRARNKLRLAAEQSPFAYQHWIETIEGQPALLAQAAQELPGWSDPPRLTVLVWMGEQAGAALRRSLGALESQCWPHWQLVLVPGPRGASVPTPMVPQCSLALPAADPASALAHGLDVARGSHVLVLAPGAMLPPTALYCYARALRDHPDAPVLFADQDHIDQRGRRHTGWFKPQWNEELFFAQDYLTSACLIRTDCLRAATADAALAPDAELYAALLSVVRGGAVPVHVPQVLCHLPDPSTPGHANPGNQGARARALRRHLAGRGAQITPGPYDTLRIAWPLPDPAPLVSIIVPTRDHARLLCACIDGVLEKTRYRDFELIIVDNGSVEPAALAYLDGLEAHPQVRVLRDPRPYNYAALNNAAAEVAQGQYLCLLNNDTQVLSPEWLGALLRQAARSQVGAVGAKLLYDDHTIQHAGVTIGLGEAAGHAHRFQRDDTEGYFARAHAQHYVSAVTGACLMVEKAKFDAVDGLDEDHLAIAFNDVDLCLKLQAAGWRNVYAPQAVLLHHESKSRGKDVSPPHVARYLRELAVLQERWGTRSHIDPLHHRGFDRAHENYLISLVPPPRQPG